MESPAKPKWAGWSHLSDSSEIIAGFNMVLSLCAPILYGCAHPHSTVGRGEDGGDAKAKNRVVWETCAIA